MLIIEKSTNETLTCLSLHNHEIPGIFEIPGIYHIYTNINLQQQLWLVVTPTGV